MKHWLIWGVCFCLAFGAAAQQTPVTATPTESDAGLACITTGYDLVLVNQGTEPLPAGTPLTWRVAFVRLQGTHVLEHEVLPGDTVHLTGALVSTYLSKPKPCMLLRGDGVLP